MTGNDSNGRRVATRKLSHLEKNIVSICDGIQSMTSDPNICLLHQYEEHLHDTKTKLSDICDKLLSMDLDDSDDLTISLTKLEKPNFDCGLNLKKITRSSPNKLITIW